MGFRFLNSKIIPKTYRDLRTNSLLLSSIDHQESHSRTSKRCHVGHTHHEHVRGDDDVFKLGLAADVALAAGKSVTGYLTGSTAIIADAAHSVSDIVLSGVAWMSFRAGKVPKDKEHPYGHGKFETLGALGISCMLLATGGGIAWHAVDLLQGILTSAPDMVTHMLGHGHNDHHSHGGHHHGFDLEHPILALSMTMVSISVKEGLFWITKRAGEREGSELMKANAWHHRADAVSSVVALIGVGGTIMGVPFLDPFAGIFVSGMIIKAGIETGYQSVLELVDAGVPLPILAPIKQTITQVEGVKGCHRLRGRKAGSFLYLDVHIELLAGEKEIFSKLILCSLLMSTSSCFDFFLFIMAFSLVGRIVNLKVDPFLSVSAAHDIGENVRRHIQDSHNQVAEVFIHIDPSFSLCSSTSDQIENLEGIKRTISNSISKEQNAEAIVSNVIASQFADKMKIEHMTRHTPQGKILLEVQVSMPLDISIRDAMNVAKEAEEEILKAVPCIDQVSIQLRLGTPYHFIYRKKNFDN